MAKDTKKSKENEENASIVGEDEKVALQQEERTDNFNERKEDSTEVNNLPKLDPNAPSNIGHGGSYIELGGGVRVPASEANNEAK